MKFKFIVLFAMCSLVTSVPNSRRPLGAESESDESSESNESGTTTVKPESKIIPIKNAADLDARISQAGDNVVIIYLMVTWCPFCMKVNPTIEKITATTENLIVLKVDRDNVAEGGENWKYGISNLPSVPRFIFIKNGKIIEELNGSDSDLWGTLSKYCPITNNGSRSKHTSKSSKDSSSSESSNSSE